MERVHFLFFLLLSRYVFSGLATDELSLLQTKVSIVEKPAVSGSCGKPFDVMLAVDQSGSIGESHFDTLKQGLEAMIKEFNLDNGNAAIGLVKFGTGAVKMWEGLSSNEKEVVAAVEAMTYDGGWTHTHSGISLAASELAKHGRQGVAKLIVVVTDGECREGKGELNHCDNKVRQTATKIKADGIVIDGFRHPVTIVTVGFGKAVGSAELTKELKSIATGLDDILVAEHYSDFTQVAPKLGSIACEDVVSMTSPKCSPGSCLVWGDPHVMTFKQFNASASKHSRAEVTTSANRKNIHDDGSHWLVKTQDIHIRAVMEHNQHTGHTSVQSLEIGGSFIKNNHLSIGTKGKQTTWNGTPIVKSLGDDFENNFVHVLWHSKSHNAVTGLRDIAMDVLLPDGVYLTVNRWKSMLAAEIEMCIPESNPNGLCGSSAKGSK